MITLTEEQKFIINQPLKQGERFKITAFAGTGKTSTLIAFSRVRPHAKFLYIAFNKSMQLQAAKRFLSNVICRTIHSLAYADSGRMYQHKIGSLKTYQVVDALDLPNYMEARYVQETLMNFIASSDRKIHLKHIPFIKSPRLDYVDLAQRIWHLMCDVHDTSIPMEHDGYLKLFQLNQHQLQYDFILLDEAQDCNPVSMGIVENQQAPIILVGDTHQQLYSFRGAINAMDEIETHLEADLTGSFRFDNTVAELANSLVAYYKEEDRLLKGLGSPCKIGKTGSRFALLARTNAGLFDKAVELHKTKKIHYLGGIEQLKLDQLIDTWHLWHGNPKHVNDIFIKRFKHFSELTEYAKSTEDKEIQSRISIIEKYRYEIPILINKIRIKSIEKPVEADCLFTTVHKAKGLEFKQVRLNDDFIELVDVDELKKVSQIEPEEVNILYVAITRAKEVLELNDDMALFKKLVPKMIV